MANVPIPIFSNYRLERKNIANGYLNDIENINRTLTDVITVLEDPRNPDYHKNAVKITRTLYHSWGLYYSNRQDIAKFDPKVSEDLYRLYYKILNAEDIRQIFNNYDMEHPINTNLPIEEQKMAVQNAEYVKFSTFISMHLLMIDCYKYDIPNLKAELQKEIAR